MFVWESSNEQKIMSRLFADVAKYCSKSEFTDEKMSTLLGTYFYTHLFNKSLDMLSFDGVYDFYKTLMIHHSVLVRLNYIFFSLSSTRILSDQIIFNINNAKVILLFHCVF